MYCSHSLERRPCQLVTFALFISSHIGGLWSTGVSRKKAGHCSAKRGIAFLSLWCDLQIHSFSWHQSFASFRPTKFVPKKQPSPGVGKTGVSDVFFCSRTRKIPAVSGYDRIVFYKLLGPNGFESWIPWSWVVNYRKCWFWGRGIFVLNIQALGTIWYYTFYILFLYSTIIYIYVTFYIIAHVIATQLMVNWWFGSRWFGILGLLLSRNHFHKGIPNIQTTGPQTTN